MIVFVHGVPETAALWNKLRGLIDRESVAVSLPGFGCPRPAEFGATKDDYVEWLLGELSRVEGPIDLVGHDWGAGLTYRIATAHGDMLRSWVADVGNIMHPNYEWHEAAKLWQTPGAGESYFQRQGASGPGPQIALFERMGVPHEDAPGLAGAIDAPMASCILDVYRSAMPNPYSQWSDAWGHTAAPGLVLNPTEDPFGQQDMAAEVASMLGAGFETLDGLGHFWPLQGPDVAAAALDRFWGSVE
ncbi:MAG: alpha/beta hydrolase [Actinomycetota bacterium]|nr:alpha/beta hydrolase [Actinomycetota bacterium]